MTYDIEFTQGDSNDTGAVMYEYNSILQSNYPIDLTDCTVTLTMKDIDSGEHRYTINCTLGGTYLGSYFSETRGGVTVPFTTVETLVSGLFIGKWTISGTTSTGRTRVAHVPSGQKYLQIMIWEGV